MLPATEIGCLNLSQVGLPT